jgi:hypothetical protein
MKIVDESENLDELLKGADLFAKRKAFRNNLPYAILIDGEVTLVYPDKHTEIATPEHLEQLHLTHI